jgi:hypothetical protein
MTKPDADEALFATRWVHAFEEDTAEAEVYRPDTDEVPLSRRPRRFFTLSRDGTARVLAPGPDDRPVETPATWTREGGDLVIRPAGAALGKAAAPIRIHARSGSRLEVRKPGRAGS